MRLVIADTGPINYLLLIGHIEILPALFEKVILPSAVKDELSNPDTPLSVRDWIAQAPLWVDVRQTTSLHADESIAALGPGETGCRNPGMSQHNRHSLGRVRIMPAFRGPRSLKLALALTAV